MKKTKEVLTLKKYQVKDYINQLKRENILKEARHCEKILDQVVENMTFHSKEVVKKTAFICKGANFKIEYLQEAIQAGAFVYISEEKYDVKIPSILVSNIRRAMSLLGDMYYGNPGKDIHIIGITGTKGKTTTTYYLRAILDEYEKNRKGKKTAYISTIETYDGIEKFMSYNTTPESFEIHRHFRNAVESKISNVIMEVSSQALKYGRVEDVCFDIGMFLNISEDHISAIEHQNFEDYFTSKLKIFSKTKSAIVNLDDPMSERILKEAKKASQKVITFSTRNENADLYAYQIEKEKFDTIFRVKTSQYDEEFKLTIPGLFNVENALAAMSAAYLMKIPIEDIKKALESAKISGRMEIYHTKDEKIYAIVDYAHNKASYERVFESVKKEYPDRKIITVFGSTGNKAIIRRKDLGTIAGKNSSYVWITADDPGTEKVGDILRDIEEYVKQYMTNYSKIEDRECAIKEAVSYAKKLSEKSIILLLGKGNETTQKCGKVSLPYRGDGVIVREWMKEYDTYH